VPVIPDQHISIVNLLVQKCYLVRRRRRRLSFNNEIAIKRMCSSSIDPILFFLTLQEALQRYYRQLPKSIYINQSWKSICCIVQGSRATLSYLRILPSPDQDVLSFFLCLSLHPYSAAKSGNAASDRAAEVVMMRMKLEMSHTPGRPKVRRGSLVLIAPPGALAVNQSKIPRHAVRFENYRAMWYANICISG